MGAQAANRIADISAIIHSATGSFKPSSDAGRLHEPNESRPWAHIDEACSRLSRMAAVLRAAALGVSELLAVLSMLRKHAYARIGGWSAWPVRKNRHLGSRLANKPRDAARAARLA